MAVALVAGLALGVPLGLAVPALDLALNLAEVLLNLLAHGLGVPAPALAADLGPRCARLAQGFEHLDARVLRRPGGLPGLFLGPLAAGHVKGPQSRLEQARRPFEVIV